MTATSPDLHDLLDAGSVQLTVDGPRADVLLARPDARNAQTPATWRALAAVPSLLPDDVRVVVLSAAGRSFSAGLDRRMFDGTGIEGEPGLVDMAAMEPSDLDRVIAEFQDGFTWWRRSAAVTIAAVQGHAVGAGFQLALACDLVVCAADAQFAMREPALGLVPDLAGTRALVETVGYRRALEICGTARWVGADEASRLGIAQVVVDPGELAGTVDDLVAALLAVPGGALAGTKRLLRDALARSPQDQLAAERAEQAHRLAELARLVG